MEYKKEFNDYGQRNDHANGEELMVLITLAEYRELIRCRAVDDHEKDKLRSRLYETDRELASVKEKLLAAINANALGGDGQ